MKRFQFIVCKVMQREAYFCAAKSKNIVDVVLMDQGLHNEPDKLRAEVQKALDKTTDIQGRPYDASLLGYGLCSNGIVGLSAKIPIVVPRGHDCVTLLLGSKEKYREYHLILPSVLRAPCSMPPTPRGYWRHQCPRGVGGMEHGARSTEGKISGISPYSSLR